MPGLRIPSTFASGLILLCLLALALRLAILQEFLLANPFSRVLFSDDWVYWVAAAEKADGHWLEPTPFLSAPLYPYLLGLLRWLGGGLLAVYLLQLALGIAAIALLADAARRRFGPAVGLAAGLLFALADDAGMAFTRVLGDSLQVFLAVALLWAWVRLAEQPRVGLPGALGTGALLGLLVLAWPPAQLLLPLLAVWLLRVPAPWPRRALLSAAAVLAAALAISPATLHNLKVGGEFIPVSANAGINLLQGNNPEGRGVITELPGIRNARQHMFADMARIHARETGRQGSWKEVDRHFRDRAVQWWLAHPGDGAALLARKLWWFLTDAHYDNVALHDQQRALGLYQRAVLVPLELPWIMGLAFLGLVLMACDPRRYAPELAILALALLVCLVFHYSGRYRLPAAPVLCLLAALAVLRWRALPLPAPGRIALALLPLPLWLAELHLGITDMEHQRADTAVKVAYAWVEAGDLHLRRGDEDAARADYLRAVAANPAYAAGHERLARLARRQQDPTAAAQWARRAAAAQPGEPLAHALRYNIALEAGDWEQARAALLTGVEALPRDRSLRQALAWLLAASPDPGLRDPATARTLVEETLVEADPAAAPALVMTLAAIHLAQGEQDWADALAGQSLRLLRPGDPRRPALEGLARAIRSHDWESLRPGPLALPDPWDPSRSHPMEWRRELPETVGRASH